MKDGINIFKEWARALKHATYRGNVIRNRWVIAAVALACFAVVGSAAPLYGQGLVQIYVAPMSGMAPPAADGSLSNPFQTLQQAADLANSVPPSVEVKIVILEAGEVGPASFTRPVKVFPLFGGAITITASTGTALGFSGAQGPSTVKGVEVLCRGAMTGIASQAPSFIGTDIIIDGCLTGFSQLAPGNVVLKSSTMTNNGTAVRLDAGVAPIRAFLKEDYFTGNGDGLTFNNANGVCKECTFFANNRAIAVMSSGNWKCEHCELEANGVGSFTSCAPPQCSINYSGCDFAHNGTPVVGPGNGTFGDNPCAGDDCNTLTFPRTVQKR